MSQLFPSSLKQLRKQIIISNNPKTLGCLSSGELTWQLKSPIFNRRYYKTSNLSTTPPPLPIFALTFSSLRRPKTEEGRLPCRRRGQGMRIAIGWQNTITNEILLGMPYEKEDEYKESKITGKKSGHPVHLRSFTSFVVFF